MEYVPEYDIPTRCLVAMFIGGSVGGIATAMGIPFLLGLFGFTAAGVSAGSLAAMWQSTMGGAIAGGGLFSLLQSIGAAGLGLWSTVTVTGASASLALAFCNKVDCSLGYLTGEECQQ